VVHYWLLSGKRLYGNPVTVVADDSLRYPVAVQKAADAL